MKSKRKRQAMRAATVAVLSASAVLNGGTSWAAATTHQFGGVPRAAVALPTQAEALSPYLPQASCDPNPKPGVVAFEQLTLATFRAGWSGGITRNCGAPGVAGGRSEHKEGRAWDWMLNPNSYTDQAAGARAVSWLLSDDAINARRLGVMYLIWNRRIWSAHENTVGWRPYNYGDPHVSHIHLSFSWAGAEKRTSWWTGVVAPTEYGPCRQFANEPTPAYGNTINTKPCPTALRASKGSGKVVFTTPPPSQIPDPDAPDPAAPSGTITMTSPTPGAPPPATMSTPGKERCQTTCTCC
jgi:hypothetical protein